MNTNMQRAMREITRNLRSIKLRQEQAEIEGEEMDRNLEELLVMAAELEKTFNSHPGGPRNV